MKRGKLSLPSFIEEVCLYGQQVRVFGKRDWVRYLAWVGLMIGLFVTVGGFVLWGWSQGVRYPAYVLNIPIGIFIFVVAIGFDTIGHRTRYRAVLSKGEALVHHFTIFAGILSCLFLCLAYSFPEALRIPAFVWVALSLFYSIIDEALHWHRYLHHHSDRVEMWSHFFIFVGHLLFILSWCQWFEAGYPGVPETLALFKTGS